ncbi:MAG: glutamate-cysteine ligase family protein [Gammaproteobacteria bacterium]|nr:glutamate-cysteine ligase family protein [Gammaproteobacteria bacterium]
MGQEIDKQKFDESDFNKFTLSLKKETAYLSQLFKQKQFDNTQFIAGLELEAWLIDHAFEPAAINEAFFAKASSAYLTPELAKFNIELNIDPQPLKNAVLTTLEQDLRKHWQSCQLAAQQLDAEVMAIGILPTIKDSDLTVENMSNMTRYEALNEQVLLNRNGRPLSLHIVGKENLQSQHYNVMLESAATSLQIHIQVPQDKSVAYYNSSVFISAFTVAASANSPFLFGKCLWEETRIPLFEQSVESGGFKAAADGPLHRVSFGSDYCRESLMECFAENIEHFPALLPINFNSEVSKLEHLRLHNGTIWRWNRPIIGFNADDQPHLRIEHRVIPAGPTIVDQIANIALYYGLVHYFAEHQTIYRQLTEFSIAKDNFYNAARHGLHAKVKWIDGNTYSLQHLFKDKLCDFAAQGLRELHITDSDIEYYIGIIKNRVTSGHTGSFWQQAFVKQHGKNMSLLAQQYFINQNKDKPVHEWNLEID